MGDLFEAGRDGLVACRFLALAQTDEGGAVDANSDVEVLGVEPGGLVPLGRYHDDVSASGQDLVGDDQSQFKVVVKGALDEFVVAVLVTAVDKHDRKVARVELAARGLWQIGCHYPVPLLFANHTKCFPVAVNLLIKCE